MIFPQTHHHNGLKHVSIKAGADVSSPPPNNHTHTPPGGCNSSTTSCPLFSWLFSWLFSCASSSFLFFLAISPLTWCRVGGTAAFHSSPELVQGARGQSDRKHLRMSKTVETPTCLFNLNKSPNPCVRKS